MRQHAGDTALGLLSGLVEFALDAAKILAISTAVGALIGALFGGASPIVAAQFQLVVLAGVALAMMLTGIVVTRLAGHTPYVVEA